MLGPIFLSNRIVNQRNLISVEIASYRSRPDQMCWCVFCRVLWDRRLRRRACTLSAAVECHETEDWEEERVHCLLQSANTTTPSPVSSDFCYSVNHQHRPQHYYHTERLLRKRKTAMSHEIKSDSFYSKNRRSQHYCCGGSLYSGLKWWPF